MRRIFPAAALLLVALVYAPLAFALEFEASYSFGKDPKRGRETIKKAIDDGTRDMFFAKRGIARGRLEKKNQLAKTIDISVNDKEISVIFDGKRRYTTPANGTKREVKLPDGEKVMVSQTYWNNRLTQVFEAKDGTRTNVFSFTPDKRSMTLEVTSKSEKLSKPITYDLDYKQSPPTTAPRTP